MAWCLVKHRDNFTFHLLQNYIVERDGNMIKNGFLCIDLDKGGRGLFDGTVLSSGRGICQYND